MKKEPTENKTIGEWAKEEGYKIIDPDGFDRKNPNLMTEEITKEKFDKGFPFCTVIKIIK